MRLKEYQSKSLLAARGVTCPHGVVAASLTEAREASVKIGGHGFVVKAMIEAGERGPAGGVLKAATPDGVETATEMLLGQDLITPQTPPDGLLVSKVLVERQLELCHEAYVALLINPVAGTIELIGARQAPAEPIGSMADLATDYVHLDLTHWGPANATDASADRRSELVAFASALGFATPEPVADLLQHARAAFSDFDATLLEFSPLAQTTDGQAVAIDVKMTVDQNAMFRQPQLSEIAASTDQSPDASSTIANPDVNAMLLDGDIGLVVNGAGLGMATLDMVVAEGGRPANFMDIRTGATTRNIARSIENLVAARPLRALLVNIHGGGLTKCDLVAEALAIAWRRIETPPPLVYRAAGNNAAFSETVLANCGVPRARFDSISEAVRAAVAMPEPEDPAVETKAG